MDSYKKQKGKRCITITTKNVATNAVLAAISAIANQSKTNNAVAIQNQAKNAANANQNQTINATNLAAKTIDLTKIKVIDLMVNNMTNLVANMIDLKDLAKTINLSTVKDLMINSVMNQIVAMVKTDLDKKQISK